MIPYIFMTNNEIICDTAANLEDLDLYIFGHVKDVFEEHELHLSLSSSMEYIVYDNLSVDDLMEKCFEQYWKEPYKTDCPFVAKYFDNEWIDYDVEKTVKEYICEYMKEIYDVNMN